MKKAIVSACLLSLIPVMGYADEDAASSFTEAFTKGTAAMNFRYRYEDVDQDSLNRGATANTLRARLTLNTANWHGMSALIEGDYVTDFGSDDYNSTENGKTDRPVIADIEGGDLNQLWLKYTGANFDSTLGRQRILNGNQRFVGNVGWRQNEQTYDGLRGNWRPLDGLKLDASYVNSVNRIFGPDDGANPATLDGDNFFLRADYSLSENHKVAAFGYWLDVDDDGPFAAGKTVNLSSDTYGLEYSGKLAFLDVAAAYATQSEAGDSELDYDADYYMLELGTKLDIVGFKLGYEVLASDNGTGFQTPYATLHKFQGWADMFLSTPGDGIEDLYGSVGTKLGKWKLLAVYHDFQAEDSSEDFGSEIDLSATWLIRDDLSLQAKFASFSSDSDRYSDTDKIWFVAQYKF